MALKVKLDVEEQIVSAEMSNALLTAGWCFNWGNIEHRIESGGQEKILAAYFEDELQGLIEFYPHPTDAMMYINLIESAPHNVGKTKIYDTSTSMKLITDYLEVENA